MGLATTETNLFGLMVQGIVDRIAISHLCYVEHFSKYFLIR